MKLFLDIDGVMVHANPHRAVELEEDGFYKFNETAVRTINSIEIEDIDVILSTSHRFRYQKKEWINIFRRRGIHFNKLEILNIELDHRNSRKNEIEMWIESEKIPYNDVVIIDDDKSLNSLQKELKDRLILTNPYTGLEKIDELKRFFNIKRAI